MPCWCTCIMIRWAASWSLLKKPLQHMHDELHRGVVVVEEQDPIEAGPLGLRLGLGDDRRARRARPPAFGVVVVIVVVIVSQTGPPGTPAAASISVRSRVMATLQVTAWQLWGTQL